MVLISYNLFAEADKLLHTLMQIMLDTLIQFKTRLILLLRLFALEFEESTNAARVELNRFEEAGLIQSHKDGNKKMYQVNTNFPMFNELQKIAFKHFVIDQIIEKLGDMEAVYLREDLARGLDSKVVDVTLIGKDIDNSYLARMVKKAEELIGRKIRTLTYEPVENVEIGRPNLLI